MRLYTIGFTEKSAESFFGLLNASSVNLLVDIRLRPDGQLSGFAKKGDLPYFLRELADCGYLHLPILTPEDGILKCYREDKNWNRYVERFEGLMDERGVPETLDRSMFETQTCCLLCSEASPDRCHRGLIADRLAKSWNSVEVIHLI
jgi:uncharacterized protein (DUF488 family)